MSLDDDIDILARQERMLCFPSFDADTAWELGTQLRELAQERGVSVAIEVELYGLTVFSCYMPGTNPDHADWIRRKRNVVQRFRRSSYAMGLQLKQKNTTLEAQQGLPERDYATHGGCFPIRLVGSDCIGTLAVSGLPQRDDHAIVVEVLAGYLDQPLADLALPPRPQ
ncbi:heme-degrading domain-containing protein [Chitinimonas sp.]|uniref:heme-degrading domain-containing protein n=1 Tax=Chitinimonas sp. TaxID=1934313 RepID=UPI002F92E146